MYIDGEQILVKEKNVVHFRELSNNCVSVSNRKMQLIPERNSQMLGTLTNIKIITLQNKVKTARKA